MNPFEIAHVPHAQIKEIVQSVRATYPDMPDEDLDKIVDNILHEKIYKNDQYQVSVSKETILDDAVLVHLSIRRLDREPIRDWRDMQEIKNMLVGEECEGVELYPSESRLVDTANQFHLWVFENPEIRFPFGFNRRFVSGEDVLPDLPKAKQRERI